MEEEGPKWDEVVNKYTLDRLEEAIANVEDIKNVEKIEMEKVRELVKEANYWIKDTSIDDDGSFDQELYDSYKYRVFIRPGTVTIIQGREYSVEEGKLI